MKLLCLALLLSSLPPIPATAPDVGSITLIEGSLRIIRGTEVLQAAEGISLQQGDMLESSVGGFAQLEFVGGAIVGLGPLSRLYILRHGSGGTAAKETSGAELVLLSGWLKGQSNAEAGSYRYESPVLAARSGKGTVVIHSNESECDVFLETGSAAISEVTADGRVGKPTTGTAGQFFSRRAGKSLSKDMHPSPAFLDGMPQWFRDTLPSRLAHFAGKHVEPKPQRQVSYADVQVWLTMPATWRRGFVERFEPRLKDAEFRKQLEFHSTAYPEWEPVLHPEKSKTASPPSSAPASEPSHPRI
jgi:hypothetical protein